MLLLLFCATSPEPKGHRRNVGTYTAIADGATLDRREDSRIRKKNVHPPVLLSLVMSVVPAAEECLDFTENIQKSKDMCGET